MLVCHFIFIAVMSSFMCSYVFFHVLVIWHRWRDRSSQQDHCYLEADHREACWTGNKDLSHLLLLLKQEEETRVFFRNQSWKNGKTVRGRRSQLILSNLSPGSQYLNTALLSWFPNKICHSLENMTCLYPLLMKPWLSDRKSPLWEAQNIFW